MAHRHRPVPALSRHMAWQYCVDPQHCDGRPHGGTVRSETCRCGAQRCVEITMAASRRGQWAGGNEK
jgi:hypothetical protein